MQRLRLRRPTFALFSFLLAASGAAGEALKPLSTAVIKSTAGLCLKGKTCHKDKAGVFVPKTKIGLSTAAAANGIDLGSNAMRSL